MKEIQACIFDSDGTLLDSKDLIYQAFADTFIRYFRETISDEDITSVIGKPLEECYRNIGKQHDIEISETKLVACIDRHRRYQTENLDLVKPFEGIIELLDKLSEAGIKKLAVITLRERANTIDMLENAGIMPYLQTLVTRYDAKNPKPDPSGLELALFELDVEPRHTALIGDMKEDIEMGRQLEKEMETKMGAIIGVSWGFMKQDIVNYKPDFVIDHPLEAVDIILEK